METMVLNVPDISCNHCVMTIKNAVGKLGGVQDVSVDLKKKSVTVSFEQGKTTGDSIKSAIEEQGYQVTD